MAVREQLENGALLERGRELRAIEAALAAARGGAGVLVVVEGPAGIGKTRLLTAARNAAAGAEMTVLSARGSDLEREFRWGIVRQLLEPAIAACSAPERRELLAGAAALAAPLLSAGESPAPETPASAAEGEGAFLHGLYWLCANLAARGPLLVAMDDGHWCDLASLRFVAYLARRIEGLAIALIVASRRAESPPADELLERLAREPGAAVLRPELLSGQAVAALLSLRFGVAPDARFAAACQTATQGNPFLLEELARSVTERGLTPNAAAADTVADLGPRSVARAIIGRLRALAPGAVEMARAVAVLGPDAELRRAAALADLEPEQAAAAADALVAAEILAAGRPLDFIHPLARAAIYGDLPTGERARLHAEAARMLRGETAASERVAAHLLATEPSGDPLTVELLRGAAREAMLSGAPPSAISYLERALAEPPAADLLAPVLHELGHAEALDGQAGFEEHLRRAARLAHDPELCARAWLELGRAHQAAGELGADGRLCMEGLDALGDAETALSARLEAELFMAAINETDLMSAAAPRMHRRLEQLAAGDVDDPALLAALGLGLAVSARPARFGAEVVERAAAASFPEANASMPGCIGNALLFAGELERSAAYYGEVGEEARRRGWRLIAAWCSGMRARVSLELGEARRAEEEARLGIELFVDAVRDPGHHARGYLTAHLVYVLLERGELEEAEAWLERYGDPRRPATTYGAALILGAASRLRLAQGRAEEALTDARASAHAINRDWNPACAPWRSDAALALLALGRQDEAVELAGQELALAQAFAVPHAIARALRATARCRQDLDEAAGVLEQAIATVRETPARLELARAVVELGAVLRRGGKRRAAVDQLRRGLDLAHRCGATALAERARGELVTAGARPRRALLSGVDALTASERRVGDLAAQGLTNQEIAQALFVTARTVEAHLTRAFRKLDISSRKELPQALAATGDGR